MPVSAEQQKPTLIGSVRKPGAIYWTNEKRWAVGTDRDEESVCLFGFMAYLPLYVI